ncbi:hypothetical protein KW785_01365 [Candidatus Parcubacteria bacterium]|nr:hypothetical protein [Candidatus Parcubacteria bacterium]
MHGMLGKLLELILTVAEEKLPTLVDLFERLTSKDANHWWIALRKFLRKENPWAPPTSFLVTSNGLTGEQWIARLEAAKYNVGDYAKQMYRSHKFVATNGVTYKLGVIMGHEFEDNDRTNQNIWAEGERRGWLKPSMEHSGLLRELVSDEEIERMGLWALILMHEPVSGSYGNPSILGVYRNDRGRWVDASYGRPGGRWDRERGFVFLVPQE